MNKQDKKTCPHCGASLPEEASFCPNCARDFKERVRLEPSPIRWRKPLRRVLAVLVIVALAAAGVLWYRGTRPRQLDALGEVSYTDREGSYRLMLCMDLYEPLEVRQANALPGNSYRFPVLLCALDADSGEDVGPEFFDKVKRVTAEIPTISGGTGNISCTAPDYHDAFPDTVLTSLVDFMVSYDLSSQITWTIDMENGDTIRLRMEIEIRIIQSYDYYPEDADMETAAELQALLDRLSAELPQPAIINLHLPAVTYAGEVRMDGASFNLYGSEEDGRRTAFTGTLRIAPQTDMRPSCTGIDFVGDGSGTGIVASAGRVTVEDCTLSGWETGLLADGAAWVNAVSCRFTHNAVGFCFDSLDGTVSNSMFNDNLFQGNGTALLLQQVPSDLTLDFRGSRFTGNGTDIDNRCDHPLELSEAVFEQGDD